MARELSWNSKDPEFSIKFAWALHEVMGCPLNRKQHGPDGWCSRQEHLVGIAQRLVEKVESSQGAARELE